MGWSYQGPVHIGLIVLFAVSSIDARDCKIGCHGSAGSMLRFEPGKVYNYKLEGNSVTKVAGSSGEQSKVGLTADVQVSLLSSCEHALKVTNVQVSGPDAKKYSLGKLSQQPIKFGLQNGRIESELCVNPAEDTVGLNIKRAVLSLIQSSVLKDSGYATLLETDISGTCPTGFEFSKSGNTITVKKSRDLVKCAHREEISVPYLTTPYYTKSDVQSSPILVSALGGEQKIEGGILKLATREEHYDYRPGASPEAAARVNVKTTLKFVNAAPGAIPAVCIEPRSIIFESEHATESHAAVKNIVELVRQGCDSRTVGEETAQQFSKLVRTVASASKDDILTALQQINSGAGVKNKETAQRMLKDAIVMAQSASSVEVIAEILKKKEVTGVTAKMYLLSLGAVKHATRASLTAVLPLLDGEPDINAYLGIGSLAGKFCKEHSCENVNEVNQLQIKLGAPLLKGCRANSKKEENQLIASLKGLGNIKYLGPKIAGKIVECVQDRNVRPRIRAAALETIRTDPNKEQFKEVALNIMKNIEEDSELRIKAYLVVAQCPCGKVAATVKDLLEKEESYQVGGFIVSHLRNLHATTNPDRQAARQLLGNIIPPQRFIIDPRRYSINQELSYSADIVNTGASGEANIIYSQNSYIPRTLSLNLTVHLFGTAYNLLEVDTRTENLERLAEKVFGPKGYLKTNEVDDIYEDGKHAVSSILEKIANRYDQVLRPKRSISRDNLDALAKKVHLPKESDDIDLDLSLKVLGSEVLWQHLHGSEAAKIRSHSVVDEYFGSLDSLINSLKNADIDYRRHISFLDREITYPTSMGLALKLKTQGSAALRVKLDGKVDIPAIIRDPKNTNVRLQFVPSAAINVAGEILIDAVAVEAGTRVDLNLHSSTGSDVTLRLLSGRGVDINLGLPVPKQEIISVKVDFKSVVRDDAQSLTATPIKFDTKRETYSGCFDQLNVILGLTFCGKVSVPFESGRPIYPLYGPIDMSVGIEKDDESLTSYHIKALYDHKEDVNAHAFSLLLDTPNAKTNRKVSLNVEGSLQDPKRYLTVDVASPWINTNIDAYLVNTDKEKLLNAKLTHNEAVYGARAGVSVSKSGNKVNYVPVFEYSAPEETKSALIGKKGGSKPKQLVNVGGSVSEEINGKTHTYKINDLSIEIPQYKYLVDGSVVVAPSQGSVDLKVTYDKEHVTLRGSLKGIDQKEMHASLAIAPSQFPDFGVSMTYDLLLDSPSQYDSKLVVVHGPDLKSTVNRLYLHNSYKRVAKDGKYTLLSAHHELTYPVFQAEFWAKGEVTPNSLSGGLKGKLDKYSAMLDGSAKTKEGEYHVNLNGELMGNKLNLQSSRTLESADKSRFKNSLTLKPGGTYEVNAVVTHKLKDKEMDLQIDADASVPNQPAIKLVAGIQSSGGNCRGNIKFNVGDKCLIEGNSAITSEPTPSGNYKLVLTGYLESEGKLTSDSSNLNAIATLYLPKVDRKAEAKADLTAKAPKYAGVISICYDTKDPSKTIKLQTDNTVSHSENDYSLESRNTLSHSDSELKVNVKGKANSKSLQQSSTSGEVEVVLPNKYQFGGKFTQSMNMEGKNREAEAVLELYDQPEGGKGGQKLRLSAVGKHISVSEGTIDGQAQMSYSFDGKDANVHVNLKKLPNANGKTSSINGELGASGALIASPLSLKFESEISNEYFDLDESLSLETELPLLTYKVSGSVGNDLSVDASGKLSGPTISNQLTAKFPESSPIKNLKIVSNNLIDISDESNEKSKIKLNNAIHYDNKHIKVNVEGNCEADGIQYVVEYETDSISKRRAAGSIHFSEAEGKADASINLSYDGKTADLSGKVEVDKEKNGASIHILSNTPEQGKIDIVYRQKLVKDSKGFQADLTVSTKDKKISGNAKVELEPEHPLVELNLDQPEGKSRFLFKVDKKGERHYAAELKAKYSANGGGSLAADYEANFASVDNFYFKANVEGPQLKWKKLHVDVTNKPAKGEAKKITFTVKSDDKVVVSGSSNYNFKEEGDVAVLEGNGNVKIEDQSYPLNFQATRQISENGHVAKFNAKAGKRSLNAEMKLTPTEFSFERSYCSEPKKCSKAQISSKAHQNGLEEEEQSVVVVLDLSTFFEDVSDISYKSTYKRQKLVVDHDVELQVARDSKLKYNAYIHETSAGAYLTLPKRTIGGEVKYDIARKKDSIGSVKVELDFYLNKGKEPKLCLIAATTGKYDKGVAVMAGEMKLTHPSLAKDLVVRGQLQLSDKPVKEVEGLLEIDLSKDPNNKIGSKLIMTADNGELKTVATIKSKGCNIDITYEEVYKLHLDGKNSHILVSERLSYLDSKSNKHELVAKVDASAQKIQAELRVPDLVILEADYRLDKGYSGSLNLCGKKYRDSLTINKEAKTIKYQLSGLEGGKTLNVEAGVKLGAAGNLKASLNDKKACSVDVALDESNFLNSKYSYDTEVIKSIYAAFTNDLKSLSNEVQKKFIAYGERQLEDFKHFSHCLVKALPDTDSFCKYMQNQLKAIRDELANDKAVQSASKLLKEVSGVFGEQAVVLVEELNRFLATIGQLLKEAAEQLRVSLNEIFPKVKESFQRISKVMNDVFEQYLKLSVQLVDLALNKLKEHEADIKAFADSTIGYLQEIGKVFGKFFITLNNELEKLIKDSIDNLGELPIVVEIQSRLKELKDLQIPEEVYNVYHELMEAVKQFIPTPEVGQFLDTLSDVLEKVVIKHEEIKNTDEIVKKLYNELVAAIKSIIALVAQNTPQTNLLKPAKLQSSFPVHLLRVPTGGVRFSVFNLLTNRQLLPSVNEILDGIRLSLNPLNYMPPFNGIGFVIGGTEIITYDGLHMNIQGTCSYVLSEDYKDRNFSVVGQMVEGALKSITISSRTDSIEIKPSGNAVVNGQPSTYPAHAGELWAWKRPNSLGAASKSGIFVICSPDLDNCVIQVSGFYFGRLRGLLGNLNGEKYDERMTPEGKIVENSGELANSYKLHGSCPQCPSAKHKHNRVPVCTEIFTDDASTMLCRPFVNTAPFRDACDDLASRSKDKEAAACAVSRAFTYSCRNQGVLIAEVPDQCAQCEIQGKKVGVDDEVLVEPGNAADIVLLTELQKHNEPNYNEIAVPLISELKNELGKKGISDVRVRLVGGNNPKSFYHNFYTNKDGELAFDPASNKLHFDMKIPDNNETVGGRIQILTKMLLKETASSSKSRMYQDVLEEDLFRPNALRAIVAVHGDPCVIGGAGSFLDMVVKGVLLKARAISYSVIAPGTSVKVAEGEVAVLNKKESVLCSGQKVPNARYNPNEDACVSLAVETKGNALNADGIRNSPNKPQLIKAAAEKIAASMLNEKQPMECSCSLRLGIVPQPDCLIS